MEAEKLKKEASKIDEHEDGLKNKNVKTEQMEEEVNDSKKENSDLALDLKRKKKNEGIEIKDNEDNLHQIETAEEIDKDCSEDKKVENEKATDEDSSVSDCEHGISASEEEH